MLLETAENAGDAERCGRASVIVGNLEFGMEFPPGVRPEPKQEGTLINTDRH
jgi:hypothetical protein